ncbi:MAG: GLPGLI family protein [Bacteroidota bacterium]
MRYFFSLLFLLAALSLRAQTSGVIQFEQVIKLEIELPEEFKDMVANLPNEQKSQKKLVFNAEESLYLDDTQETPEDTEISGGEGDFQFNMKFTQPDNRYYKLLAENQSVELKEFFGKNFLIKGALKPFQWKLTGEQKEIHGFVCQQAIEESDSQRVIVWFSPQIPVSNGPDNLGGLPGMILESAFEENGKKNRTLIATGIELRDLEKEEIVAPQKGKSVSQEEFGQILEEKTKELEMEMGGSSSGSGGGTVIKVIRR